MTSPIDNAPRTACLGGWCRFRDRCGRHVASDRSNVSERLCAVGHETPEPVLVAGGVAEHAQQQDQQSDDPIYRLLPPLLSGFGKFRVGAIQRQFMIGYNRASRLMQQLEHDGLVKQVPDEQGSYYVAEPKIG